MKFEKKLTLQWSVQIYSKTYSTCSPKTYLFTVLFQDHKPQSLNNMKCPVKRLFHRSGITGQGNPIAMRKQNRTKPLKETTPNNPNQNKQKTHYSIVHWYVQLYIAHIIDSGYLGESMGGEEALIKYKCPKKPCALLILLQMFCS